MGDLSDSSDTFWQLFAMNGPHARWTLATPAGVADNGGLVGSLAPAGGVVGVESSGLLGFSPVAAAVLAKGGATGWSHGILPGSLAPVPDAVAADSRGRLLALLGSTGSSIVTSNDDAVGSTAALSVRSTLAKAGGRSCELTALTAVAYGPAGQPLAGGRCESPSRLGIFELVGASWELVGPSVPTAALAAGVTARQSPKAILREAARQSVVTQVLRLSTQGSAVVALVEAVTANGTASLFRMTWSASGAWTSSPVYDVPPSSRLVALGDEANGSSFVLVSRSGSLNAVVLPPSGSRWEELPAPPLGTTTLVLEADGVAEALAVTGWTLTVYALQPGAAWSQVQLIAVPSQPGTP
jgi:hypothetical protein